MAQFDAVIPPGQEGEVILEVDGAKVSGSWRKSATIHSNDPKHPRMTLTMIGTIIRYVDVEPERLYLRGMFGEAVEKEIKVSSSEMTKDFQIHSVTSNMDDKITYRVVPGAEPGQYNIKVYKNPKLPTLNTWGSIFLQTNSKQSPEKVVQVNVVTRGAIVVQPSTVNFGAVTPASATKDVPEVEKTVTVFKVKGDFQIRDVAFSSEYYKADIEQVEEGKKYKVKVSFRPEVEQKSYVDEMIITTDDPQEPSIRVRLVARAPTQPKG